MQLYNEGPRAGLSLDQVMDVLQNSPNPSYSLGMDLLDSNDQYVDDLTPYTSTTGQISHDNYAAVQSDIQFTIEKELKWGIDRVRPYAVLSTDFAPSVRFDLGVYVLTTPIYDKSSVTPQYDVTGYDKNYLLNNPIGDTYTVPAGTNYVTAVQTMIAAAGATNSLITPTNLTLPSDMVFPLDYDNTGTLWIDAINQLLAAIYYDLIWCDQIGRYRSGPTALLTTRAPEWQFDSRSANMKSIVAADSTTETNDVWGIPNHWVFIQNGLTVAPVEGVGKYTVDNFVTGPSSQMSLGRQVNAVYFYDAADQPTLMQLGNAKVAVDMADKAEFDINTAPIYLAGNLDVISYVDDATPAAVPQKFVASTFTLPLDGSDMTWQWERVS